MEKNKFTDAKNGLKKGDKDRYDTYIKDIEIARKEMVDMKLFPEHGILCDLYAIPSHNLQAYYGIVYENDDGLELVYARTEIYVEHFTEPIKMYPFKYVKEAGQHRNVESRIIMGIRTLSPEFASVIRDIAVNIPKEHISSENIVTIDGVFQGVRIFEDEKVIKQIVYTEADKLILPKDKQYIKEVLNNLYLEVGKIIDQEKEQK